MIISEQLRKQKKFSDINEGDCFKNDGALFIKCEIVKPKAGGNVLYNSVNLANGRHRFFPAYTDVEPINATVEVVS